MSKRSSAQGNCSAKSVAGNVVDSSLSSLSSTSHANTNPRGVQAGGTPGQGDLGWGVQARGSRLGGPGWGQGTFHPPCHVLHYHMVLRPKGPSHNEPCVPSRHKAQPVELPVSRRPRLEYSQRPQAAGRKIVSQLGKDLSDSEVQGPGGHNSEVCVTVPTAQKLQLFTCSVIQS